jgi:PKD domain-containing protein
MLLGSVALSFLAAILFAGSPLLAMAQQTGTTTTTTTIPSPTTAPPPPSPPLTPEEQEEQTRLQNVIAATNQNLDEAEKEVNGIVYTPRWSEPVWVEANSLAVLFAYCLPGEFAESGQEILGGFELEVLESYEIALAQGFMAWMMVIGNEDRQDRLPAAVGVICTSDLNDVETRVISPQEQQQINNVVQQFITTTQVTNIEQVINIINNVTTNGTTTGPVTPPPTNETGPVTPPPPTNDTVVTPPPNGNGEVLVPPETGGEGQPPGTEEQPLIAVIITNATQAYTGATIKFDASITGGTPPYTYSWSVPDFGVIDQDRSITQMFFEPGTFFYLLTVTDSSGKKAGDSVQIVISERPGGVLPPPETGQEGQPPGGGLLPGIVPGEEEQQEQPQVPPPTVPEGGGEEDTTEEEATTSPANEGGGG